MEYISKKEKRRLLHLIKNTNWKNEEEVFDCAVELSRISIMLRAKIIAEHEYD